MKSKELSIYIITFLFIVMLFSIFFNYFSREKKIGYLEAINQNTYCRVEDFKKVIFFKEFWSIRGDGHLSVVLELEKTDFSNLFNQLKNDGFKTLSPKKYVMALDCLSDTKNVFGKFDPISGKDVTSAKYDNYKFMALDSLTNRVLFFITVE
jgi:hypothetical protein